MKKFLTLFLALAMIFCLAACGGDETSTPESTPDTDVSTDAGNNSTADASSTTADTSSDEPSVEPSEDPSEPADESSEPTVESSEDTSSEESTGPVDPNNPDLEVADKISQFINWKSTMGQGAVGNAAADPQAVQMTHLNVGVKENLAGIHAFNADYEDFTIVSADGEYTDYYVYTFVYNHDIWGYEIGEVYDLDAEDKDEVEIPDDGYVVAVHKYFEAEVNKLNALEKGTVVLPYGFRGTSEVDITIGEGTATIDGKVSEDEWGDAVWEVDPDVPYVSYEQFDIKGVEEYYSTAKVYMMYDETNLYLAVVVDSPYHFCNLTQTDAGDMWSQECIQVNVTPISPRDNFYSDNDYWDWNNKASQSVAETTGKNLMRQYGFSVNSTSGEQLSTLWQGDSAKFAPEFKVVREGQNTIYEVAIPWAELGAEGYTPESGAEIGVSISFNSGRSKDDFMNYYFRDGGGIIGRNDWTKIPVVTLD